MDKVNLGYSTKNVPIPPKKEYLKRLIHSAEKFIRSVRWKSFFYLHPEIKPEQKQTFGFNSTKNAPPVPELKELEEGMLNLVQNVDFKQTNNTLQQQLEKDKNDINNDSRLLIAADKTNNFYKVEPDHYSELLKNNITKDYKKAPENLDKNINRNDKKIATKLDLADRIDTTAKNQAFITLKDHKPNFNNRPTCRLINPTKSEVGKISKQILERINSKIRLATKIHQWKNTYDVIDWFKNINSKSEHSFICFDVCEFYPSINEELLTKALHYADNFDAITEEEKNIILHAKQSLLYNESRAWCKKGDTNFDVTMGSFDGAETCELIGLFILSQMQHLDINVGLYRDDGLAVCNKTPRQVEQIKKQICKIFSDNKLKITIQANMKSVDFLDITMDLRNGIYKPYMKPNNTPLYVHSKSNHPPNIIKNIPESINRRLSSISCNEEVFKEAAPAYQDSLKKCGYKYQLKYEKPNVANPNPTHNRRRQRKISWFNPPYSENVSTNIGKQFLKLVNKCFPPGHKLNKLLNRNTVKVSYSCMPNMGQIIRNHNKSVINKNESVIQNKPTCNCRNSNSCPVEKKCLTKGVIYQATVTRNDNSERETYIGLTENTFKERYTGHKSSFEIKNPKNATALSQYIWSLKDLKVPFSVNWKIVARSNPYSTSSKICSLCLTEKYFIIFKPDMATLNHRNEMTSSCRHRKKHLLASVK